MKFETIKRQTTWCDYGVVKQNDIPGIFFIL